MDRHLSVVTQIAPTLGVTSSPTWDSLFFAFTAELRARGSAPAFVSGRMAQLRRLSRELSGQSPSEVSTAQLLAFLTRPEWSHRTRKASRASVVDFFAWGFERGYVPSDASSGLPRARDIGTSDSSSRESFTGAHVLERAEEDPATAGIAHPARSWAREVGFPHAATGRLSDDVVAAWRAAGAPISLASDGFDRGWAPVVAGFVRELGARGCRPGTVHLRLLHLRQFSAFVCDEPSSVTREVLIDFLANPSWAPETRRTMRSTLVTFFTWAHEFGRLTSNPARRLPAVKVPQGAPSPAPESVIRDAINGARADVRLMILLGALAGLRRGEIAGLSVECITDEGLRVEGKGGKVRIVPMHPALASEMAAYVAYRELRAGALFRRTDGRPFTVNHVGVLISRRMPAGWSAHKLRHRFASRSYAGQYNIRAVQQLLGHSSPTVTARYVAVPEAALSDAVLAVPPIPGIEAMTHRPRSVRANDEFPSGT